MIVEQADTSVSGIQSSAGYGIGNLALLQQAISDRMYADPKLAVVREILSNARDAHREAGIAERPVRISLPSLADPNLRIADDGIGINADRMLSSFCSYCASTKSDSNEYTGGFGLGCKTPFAVATSFLVVTTAVDVDGVRRKRTWSHFKDGVGLSSYSCLAEYETDEPTGTEIVIPAPHRDRDHYADAFRKTCRWWNPIPQQPEDNAVGLYNRPYEIPLAAEVSALPDDQQSVVLLDDIPYQAPDGTPKGLLFRFNTGDLPVAVTRDVLAADAGLKIAARLREVHEALHGKGSKSYAWTAFVFARLGLSLPHNGWVGPVSVKAEVRSYYLGDDGDMMIRARETLRAEDLDHTLVRYTAKKFTIPRLDEQARNFLAANPIGRLVFIQRPKPSRSRRVSLQDVAGEILDKYLAGTDTVEYRTWAAKWPVSSAARPRARTWHLDPDLHRFYPGHGAPGKGARVLWVVRVNSSTVRVGDRLADIRRLPVLNGTDHVIGVKSAADAPPGSISWEVAARQSLAADDAVVATMVDVENEVDAERARRALDDYSGRHPSLREVMNVLKEDRRKRHAYRRHRDLREFFGMISADLPARALPKWVQRLTEPYSTGYANDIRRWCMAYRIAELPSWSERASTYTLSGYAAPQPAPTVETLTDPESLPSIHAA